MWTILMSAVVGLALLASIWSFHVWRYRGDSLNFVDGCLPKRSFDAFNYQTNREVQEDVLIAHERGVTAALIPFAVSSALWFLAFVTVLVKLRQKVNSANQQIHPIAGKADSG